MRVPKLPQKSFIQLKVMYFLDFYEYSKDTVFAPKIYLHLRTEKIYSTTGLIIVALLAEGNNNYLLYLWGIKAGPGFEGSAPAGCRVVINPTFGTHWLNFKYQIFSAFFLFMVTDSSIVIKDTSTNFMIPEYLTFWRFPVNSFVYHFISSDTNHNRLYHDFLDTLLNRVNLQEFHFPEYGQNPFPESYTHSWNSTPSKFFKYQTESDFYRCADILCTYEDSVLIQYPGVLNEFYDWKGRFYY